MLTAAGTETGKALVRRLVDEAEYLVPAAQVVGLPDAPLGSALLSAC
jgi:hypothetical protein